MPIGLTIPFSKSTGSLGYFEFTNDEFSAIREDIKSLLLTNWGERPMHYNFGCNFIEFMFEPDSSLHDRIRDRIIDQVSLWLPFVQVVNLDVKFSSDDPDVPENSILVLIKFKLTSRPGVGVLNQIVIL